MTGSPQQSMAEGLVMFRNGSVYTPADPLATAVLVEDGRIAWVGGEGGADSLTDARVRTVDLDGLLVAPGFLGGVAALPSAEETAALRDAGYTGVLVLPGGSAGLLRLDGAATRPEPAGGAWCWHPVPGPGERTDAGPGAGTDPTTTAGGVSEDRASSRSARGGRVPRQAPGHLLVPDASGAWTAELRDLLAGGASAGLLQPAWPVSGPTDDTEGRGSNQPASPWESARTGLGLGPSPAPARLPVRAVFTAQTRGVHRVWASPWPLAGQLVPGAPADLVGWRAEALMVQTADDRIAAWSTDPRARQPLLPELTEGALPTAQFSLVGQSLRWRGASLY